MINRVIFENFRGLKRLELPELSQITLLTGRNNAGKTSVLEGVFLFMDHASPESFGRINNFRKLPLNINPADLWAPAFFQLNTANPLRIIVYMNGEQCLLNYERDDSFIPTDQTGTVQKAFSQFSAATRNTYLLKYRYQQGEYTENGYFSINETGLLKSIDTSLPNNQIRFLLPTRFINENIREDIKIADWLGQVELKGSKRQIIDVLRSIEPGLSDVFTISLNGQTQVFVNIAEQRLPIKLAGDGLNRLLYYLLAIMENPNSVLLIDEVDTGIHYSLLETLWSVISYAAKESRCQVIATTHSYECIRGAVNGISKTGMEDNFCLYRIEHTGEKHQAVLYPGDLVKDAIRYSMEVR